MNAGRIYKGGYYNENWNEKTKHKEDVQGKNDK